MSNWFTEILQARPEIFIPFVGIVGLTIVVVTRTIASSWQRAKRMELEVSLKHEMIARGMSADEIKEVLQAQLGSKKTKS